MTTIIAGSDLYNPREYGRVSEGQYFTVRDDLAKDLVATGKARLPAEKQSFPAHLTLPSARITSARWEFH